MSMQYERTERDILINPQLWAANAIRLFTLDGIGVDSASFIRRFRPIFASLPWDYYDKRRKQLDLLQLHLPQLKGQLAKHYKKYYLGEEPEAALKPLIDLLSDDDKAAFESILPDRRRLSAFFHVMRSRENAWEIQRLEQSAYMQKVEASDYRSLPRVYDSLAAADANDPLLHAFLRSVAEMTREVCPDILEMEFFVYINATVAHPGIPGDNSPEGVHQDGADYIVSALVISRENIRGGQSIVYLGEAATESILKTTLNPGQGIFQADGGSSLWHDVSKIIVKDDSRDGVRCTIGVDVMLRSRSGDGPPK